MAPIVSDSEMDDDQKYSPESPMADVKDNIIRRSQIKVEMRTGEKKRSKRTSNSCDRKQRLEQVLAKQSSVNDVHDDNEPSGTKTFEDKCTQTEGVFVRISYLEDQVKNSDQLVEVKIEEIANHKSHSTSESDHDSSDSESSENLKKLCAEGSAFDDEYGIKESILKKVDWNSYTRATRKLLTLTFPRKTLGTHSLSGKPSPAFPDRPAKKQLDPAKVDYIARIVRERCNVSEGLVRNIIRTKCADESKKIQIKNAKLAKRNKLNKTK